MIKPTMYLFFGAQGSGKSTQAEILADKLELPIYNTGNELRKFISGDSDEARRVHEIVTSGALVESSVIEKIFREFIKNNDVSRGIVLDGLPRNMEQCPLVEGVANEHDWPMVAVYIEITDQTAKNRISKRTVIVNGKEEMREDDKPEILEKRLATFKAETLPVLNWFKCHQKLVIIDGEPKIEDVTKLMLEAVGE